MTPSLFECAAGKRQSELDIASGWGNTSNARAVLERHWDTFVNQSDFEYLASIGINTVRLPIGYWNLGPAFCQDTAFAAVAEVYENCWPRIVRAINWAGEAGVGVLIDMHGAVGSQNGQSHSGISDGATNLFTDEGNTNKTIAALAFLTSKLANVTNMAGIQILNEPKNTPELYGFCELPFRGHSTCVLICSVHRQQSNLCYESRAYRSEPSALCSRCIQFGIWP